MYDRLRIVHAGCGYVAQFHIPGWQQLPGIEVTAVCNLEKEQAENCARAFSIPRVYTDIEDMLDREKPDVIDISTGPAAHLQIIKLAVQRGIHVCCQKPLARSMEEAEEMYQLIEQSEIRFMIHENWRWQSWYRDISTALNESALGQIFYCHISGRNAGTVLTPEHPDRPYYIKRQPFFKDMEKFIIFESMYYKFLIKFKN